MDGCWIVVWLLPTLCSSERQLSLGHFSVWSLIAKDAVFTCTTSVKQNLSCYSTRHISQQSYLYSSLNTTPSVPFFSPSGNLSLIEHNIFRKFKYLAVKNISMVTSWEGVIWKSLIEFSGSGAPMLRLGHGQEPREAIVNFPEH